MNRYIYAHAQGEALITVGAKNEGEASKKLVRLVSEYGEWSLYRVEDCHGKVLASRAGSAE